MVKFKFPGSYSELQNKVALTGLSGIWRDLGNQKQYKTCNATLNFYQSNHTVYCQGHKADELGSAVVCAMSKAKGAGSKLTRSPKEQQTELDHAMEREKHRFLAEKLQERTRRGGSRLPVTREWAQNTRKRIGLALTCCGELNGTEMGFLDDIERKLCKPNAGITDKQMHWLIEIFDKAGC